MEDINNNEHKMHQVQSILMNRVLLNPTLENLIPLFTINPETVKAAMNIEDPKIKRYIPNVILRLSKTSKYRPILDSIYKNKNAMKFQPETVLKLFDFLLETRDENKRVYRSKPVAAFLDFFTEYRIHNRKIIQSSTNRRYQFDSRVIPLFTFAMENDFEGLITPYLSKDSSNVLIKWNDQIGMKNSYLTDLFSKLVFYGKRSLLQDFMERLIVANAENENRKDKLSKDLLNPYREKITAIWLPLINQSLLKSKHPDTRDLLQKFKSHFIDGIYHY